MNQRTFELSENDEYNLGRRFKSLCLRQKTGWEDFEHFAEWAMKSGYFKNAYLRLKDNTKPYGPDNAYWSKTPEPIKHVWPKVYIPPFCRGCTKHNPATCGGCPEWRDDYIRNWNENIHRDVPEDFLTKQTEECFAYETPDLIREGLIFGR